MGLRIGQLTASLTPPTVRRGAGGPQVSLVRETSNPAPQVGFGRVEAEDTGSPFFARERPEPPQVGFGEGTVSVPGSAVQAIDRNFTSARRVVPSLEETREQLRTRLDEQRELFTRPAPETTALRAFSTPERAFRGKENEDVFLGENRPSIGVELNQGQALARTRSRQLINSLDATAAAVGQRFSTQGAPQEPGLGEATVRIGSETVALNRPEGAPIFDISI